MHWKLSGKFDELKTKEYGSSDDRRTLILVDASRIRHDAEVTDNEWLNCVFDIAVSVSAALQKIGLEHRVGWFNDGKFNCSAVTDSDSIVEMVEKLMSVRVCESHDEDRFYFSRSPECSAYTKIIFVGAAIDVAMNKEHPGHDLTVLSVDEHANMLDEGSVKFICIPCDDVAAVLSVCEL